MTRMRAARGCAGDRREVVAQRALTLLGGLTPLAFEWLQDERCNAGPKLATPTIAVTSVRAEWAGEWQALAALSTRARWSWLCL